MPDAFPAVTTPSLAKTGFNFSRLSIVVWGLACSSWENSSGPFLPLRVIDSISDLNAPAAWALINVDFNNDH